MFSHIYEQRTDGQVYALNIVRHNRLQACCWVRNLTQLIVYVPLEIYNNTFHTVMEVFCLIVYRFYIPRCNYFVLGYQEFTVV